MWLGPGAGRARADRRRRARRPAGALLASLRSRPADRRADADRPRLREQERRLVSQVPGRAGAAAGVPRRATGRLRVVPATAPDRAASLARPGHRSGVVKLRLVRDDWALERTWAIDPTRGRVAARASSSALAHRRAVARPAAAGIAAVAGLALGMVLALNVVQVGAAYRPTTGTAPPANRTPPTGWTPTSARTRRMSRPRKWPSERATSVTSTRTTSCTRSHRQGFDGTWAGEPVRALVTWQREPYVADVLGGASAPRTP